MQQACCHLPPLPAGQQARHAAAISGRSRGVRRRCAPASSSSGVCWPHGPPVLVPAAAVMPCCSRPQQLGCSRPPAALRSRVVPRTFFSDWRGPLGGSSSSSPGFKQQQQPPLHAPTAAAAGGQPRQQPSQQQQPGPNSNFFSIAAQAALGASTTHLTGSSGGSGSSQQQQQQFSDSSTGSGSDSGLGASAKQLLQTAVHSLDMFEPRELGSSSYEDHEAAMESDEEGGMQSGTLATAHIVKANYEVRVGVVGGLRRL